MELTEEVKDLFKRVRVALGAPIRKVQLTDEQLCVLLENVVGDYASYVQNWVIESNWLNLNGKTNIITNPNDLAYALTTRTMDWSKDYSYWFSKEIGLQQRGNFELKKDFFQIEKGKQCYLIPSGREINRVMYVTPSTTKAALYGNLGTLDTGIGGGFGQYGNMGNGMGITGFYVGSAYDTALLATDLKYKNSLLRGDLTYKVTAGPDGTHIVHLMSVPGSPNMIGGVASDDSWGWNKFANCYVWYTYYDTSNSGDTDSCLIENRDSILVTPDQVPLSKMRYELMNEPTQQTLRQLLIAEAKITLGIIRGTYSGEIKIPDAEAHLDYQMLLEMGKQEKENVLTNLKERLERMLPWNIIEQQAKLMDSMLNVMSKKPLPQPIIVI
jgi:hypothetical protein